MKEREVILYLINVFFRFRITDWLVSSLKHNVLLRIGQRGKVREEEERGKKKKHLEFRIQITVSIKETVATEHTFQGQADH